MAFETPHEDDLPGPATPRSAEEAYDCRRRIRDAIIAQARRGEEVPVTEDRTIRSLFAVFGKDAPLSGPRSVTVSFTGVTPDEVLVRVSERGETMQRTLHPAERGYAAARAVIMEEDDWFPAWKFREESDV
ncbi:MAG: hypothetical protein PHW10_04030 [Candidatus Peribacteraceae bacterium]|nr:hypothetical protein [Candidatus Peribacteraceae bacterium]